MDIADYDKQDFDYRRFWEPRQYEDQSERLALRKLLPQNGRALVDLGGGYGRLVHLYSSSFARCVLLDYSEKNLNRARIMAETGQFRNLEIKRGDIYDLPFVKGEFDTALMIRVIHHLVKPEKAFQEVARILRKDGLFILEFPNKIHLKSRIRALLKRKWPWFKDTRTVEIPSTLDDPEQKGIIFNFHPTYIFQLLEETGFRVERKISVSNFRSPLLKKLIPLRILLLGESFLQRLSSLSTYHLNFGPSLFLLCRRR